jgi:hypothetical protein
VLRLRLLMISNQIDSYGFTGYRETYERMVRDGELAAFRYVTPRVTAARDGHEAACDELLRVGAETQPDVILIVSPNGFGHDPAWVARLLETCGRPAVVYYEADPWDGWAKRIDGTMEAWFGKADVVFAVAREPHVSLFKKAGADEVRFIPQTYDQEIFDCDEPIPPQDEPLPYDAVVIASNFARWGWISRLPGAAQRARLVRKLQRQRELRLAIYGPGWSGRGVKGPVPYPSQVDAIREGLMSVNWDHFDKHHSYSSDRLPIALAAGRPHVTTWHPGIDWLPGEDGGLFLERSVAAFVRRVNDLAAAPQEDLLALGAAARTWARERLTFREAGRFLLAAVDRRLLTALPPEPWQRLAREWPA